MNIPTLVTPDERIDDLTTQLAETDGQIDTIEAIRFTLGNTRVKKVVAFDGTAGNGEVGTVALFTVTGAVKATFFARCTEDLLGATATLEVGIAGSTAAIIAQTTATAIDTGEIWHDATPDASIELASVLRSVVISNGNDVIATVGTANITDGTIEFYVFVEPISDDGTIVAA